MKKLIISAALGFMVPLMSFAQSTLGPGVIGSSLTVPGSPHNFSGQAWNPRVLSGTVYVSGNQICQPCHTPHNADITVTAAPLWNHQFSGSTYQMYTNLAGSNYGISAPDGTSKLCLSCHDGSVALGSFGGQTGTIFINGGVVGAANMGMDLRNDHPISVVYDTTAGGAASSGFNGPNFLYSTYTSPGVYTAQTKTVRASFLDAQDKIQCTSCHGAHSNSRGYQLRMSNEGSALCLACHKK